MEKRILILDDEKEICFLLSALLPEIRENHKQTKVILISAHEELLKKIQAEKNGIDCFIDKPFNKEKINTALRAIDFM